MSARRQLIAALSEDSLGGIATLQDVDHATQLVDKVVAEARAEALAEAKTEVVAWLVKKAAEGTPIERLADKVDRGAVRIFLGTGHYRDAMDAHRTEVLNEALAAIRECLRLGGQQQKGLLVARQQILALIGGETPKLPRRNVSHKKVAELCRRQPGEWQHVGEYVNDMSAYGIVRSIVKGDGNVLAYLPPGTFEARSEPTETGTSVSARYVGPPIEAGETG